MSSKSQIIKNFILVFLLNINLIIAQTITAEQVKNIQFNDTELEWVRNETIFSQFQYSFYSRISNDIESCKDLQLISSVDNYQILSLSLFSSILQKFLDHRCNDLSCKLSNYWNSTTQNDISDEEFYKYLSGTAYLLFPFVLVTFIAFSLFSFLNCLYYNYCYCCCYKYKPNAKIGNTKILFIFLVILSVLYMVCGMFNVFILNSGKANVKKSFCEVINSDIFKVINGTDFLSYDSNSTQKSDSLAWKGLNELATTINYYQKSFNDLNKTINDDISQKKLNKAELARKYNEFYTGFEDFDRYIRNETFEETDANGLSFPYFNITYICSQCFDQTYQNFYSKYFSLKNWYYDFESFDDSFYNNLFPEFANENYEDTSLNIKINIYKSLKFYNIVKDYQEVYNNNSVYIDYPWVVLFIFNFLLVICGGLVYFKIKNKIYLINQANESVLSDPQFKTLNRIKFRWVFLVVINSNMLTAFLFSIYSFLIIVVALVLYEGDIVMKTYFINNNMLDRFTNIPNGELLNNCMKNDYYGGSVETTLNLINKNTKLNNMISKAKMFEETTNNYINYDLKFYSELSNSIKGLTLSNFHSKINQTIRWDEDNDEQINYYLFPLSKYKYFTAPNETLIQFTNWNFQHEFYTNYQKQWCSQANSYDVWISNQNKCNILFPEALLTTNYIDKISDGKLYCLPINLPLSQECKYLDDSVCYADNFVDRYSNQNDFQSCTVPEDEMDSYLFSDSAEYFRLKIFNYLKFAKNEEILKNNLLNKINTLKYNYKIKIEEKFDPFISDLRESTLEIISILKKFYDIEIFFTKNQTVSINDEVNVAITGISYLKDCSYLKTANSNLLHLIKNGICGDFFGISILFSILTLLLFFFATVIIVMYFRLRTDNELSEIQTYQNTIKALEEKELKFFFAQEDYIEAEDKEENVKKVPEINKKSAFFKKITERMTIASSKTKQEGELEKNEEEDPEKKAENAGKIKKWNAIKRFNLNQAKERDERINSRKE